MSDQRKPSLILPVTITLVVLGLYVGTYYATVKHDRKMRAWHPVLELFNEKRTIYHVLPNLCTSRKWNTFFHPIHWLDRRIRPQYWRWD
jgi:hypothetical protein